MKPTPLILVGLLLCLSGPLSAAASEVECQPSPSTRSSAKLWSIAGDEEWSTHAWVKSLEEGRRLRSQSAAASTNVHAFLVLKEETFFSITVDHIGTSTLSLRPDWTAKLQNASVDIVDGIRQGIVQGVSIGSNLMWKNVSWPTLGLVATAVRSAVTTALGGPPDNFLLHIAEPATLFLTSMNQGGRRVDFLQLPEDIDLLSLSTEPQPNNGTPQETEGLKEAESNFFRTMIHQHWFYSNILKPKLNRQQQFLFQAGTLSLPIPAEYDAGTQIDTWATLLQQFDQWIEEDMKDLDHSGSRIGGILAIPRAFITQPSSEVDSPSSTSPNCLTRFLEVLLDRRSEKSEEPSAR